MKKRTNKGMSQIILTIIFILLYVNSQLRLIECGRELQQSLSRINELQAELKNAEWGLKQFSENLRKREEYNR